MTTPSPDERLPRLASVETQTPASSPAPDDDRLAACGWSTIDPARFSRDPDRLAREVSPEIIGILRDYSPGSRVLELCCGTGTLVMELAKAGYAVTGVDLSSGMLAILQQHLSAGADAAVAGRVRTVQADVCAFDLKERFDFIIMEDDSFVYLHTGADQFACLRRVREHLAETGVFLLRFSTPQREMLADEEYEYDELRQIKTLPCDWTLVAEDGTETHIREGVQHRRLTWPCELELLLAMAGLEVIERWGDLERTPLREPAHQEYCYLMRRSDAQFCKNG